MPREDLLALSIDDLAALSTRGKVNEARRDLDSGITGTLTEAADGTLRVQWSDQRHSELPPRSTLRGGRCSCQPIDPCKHLVRLVLLYQRQHAEQAPTGLLPAAEAWDPGALSDEELARHFRPAALARIRKQFDAGILAEVVRSARPVARFHLPVATVRFLLPGNLAFAQCDCARPTPCEHAVLAVWAFRQLPAQERAGIVTAGCEMPLVPREELDGADALLGELFDQGIAGAARHWPDQISRLAQRLEQAELIWPAEILGELLQQYECYINHDARFDPGVVIDRLGELVLRVDAIRAGVQEVPQVLIRGSRADRPVDLNKGVFWGLGCGIRILRAGVDLLAYFYDTRSAQVVALSRSVVAEQDVDQERSFTDLSRFVAVKGVSYAQVGVGILQLAAGRRSATYELLPGRAAATVQVQDRYAWEEIASPVLVEECAELQDRLASLPPSSLRPRRLAEDFHVLRVAEVQGVRFDAASQQVQAQLLDRRGQSLLLEHPYTSRGRHGAETLLAHLRAGQEKVVFVSGAVQRRQSGLVIHPVCLILQQGDRRRPLQPWIDGPIEGVGESSLGSQAESRQDPVGECLQQVLDALGDLLVMGLSRADGSLARRWRELVQRAEATGFSQLASQVEALAQTLEQKAHTLHWNSNQAQIVALQLVGLLRLARDLAI